MLAVSHQGAWDSSQGAWLTLLASPSPLRDFHSSPGAETRGFGWKAPPALLGIPEIQDLCSRPELHGGGSWTNMQSRLLCEPRAIPFLSHQGPDGTCPISPLHCAHRVLLPSLTTPHRPTGLCRAVGLGCGLQVSGQTLPRRAGTCISCASSPALPALPCLVQVQLMTIFLAFTYPQLQGLVQVPVATFMWAPGYTEDHSPPRETVSDSVTL